MARKSPAEKIQQIRRVARAWEGIAPDAVFYGMTLQQFKAAVQPSEETRGELDDLRRRVDQTTDRRDHADVRSMRLIEGISNGVKGNPKFGEDSALYALMGYVRASARRKRRKRK